MTHSSKDRLQELKLALNKTHWEEVKLLKSPTNRSSLTEQAAKLLQSFIKKPISVTVANENTYVIKQDDQKIEYKNININDGEILRIRKELDNKQKKIQSAIVQLIKYDGDDVQEIRENVYILLKLGVIKLDKIAISEISEYIEEHLVEFNDIFNIMKEIILTTSTPPDIINLINSVQTCLHNRFMNKSSSKLTVFDVVDLQSTNVSTTTSFGLIKIFDYSKLTEQSSQKFGIRSMKKHEEIKLSIFATKMNFDTDFFINNELYLYKIILYLKKLSLILKQIAIHQGIDIKNKTILERFDSAVLKMINKESINDLLHLDKEVEMDKIKQNCDDLFFDETYRCKYWLHSEKREHFEGVSLDYILEKTISDYSGYL